MNKILIYLLTLLFSLSGPAMGEYSHYGRSSIAAKSEIIPWDAKAATVRLLGVSMTPDGKQINFHAADRMVNPPAGRAPMSVAEVDNFINTATSIKKVTIDNRGTSVTLMNANYPKVQIAIDPGGNGSPVRIITVVNPKK